MNMKTITYYKWKKLTAEEQNDYVARGILPYVPQADLRGCLLMSRMVIVEEERYWKVERADGVIEILPEFMTKTVSGVSMWGEFNPIQGNYEMWSYKNEKAVMRRHMLLLYTMT
jgi:hypothetical protein